MNRFKNSWLISEIKPLIKENGIFISIYWKLIKYMKTKLDKNVILEAIEQEANLYVRKANIYETLKSLNQELKSLYENRPAVMSFGFKNDNDGFNKNTTGFKEPQNLSYIAQLEQDMKESDDASLNEVEILKQENEVLRKELEELKKILN